MPASSAKKQPPPVPPAPLLQTVLLALVVLTACTTTPSSETTPSPTTQASGPHAPPATGSAKDGGEGSAHSTPAAPAPETSGTEEFSHLIGLDETAAEALVLAQGRIWRVVSRDGQDYPVTMDYSPDRINATITNEKVTRITVG